MTRKDAFDIWREWAGKPADVADTIDRKIHDAVMALPPDERGDRAAVNGAVRDGLKLGPRRPAGTADKYGVPIAMAALAVLFAGVASWILRVVYPRKRPSARGGRE